MILAIAIISGVFFLLNTFHSWAESKVKGSPGIHAIILILSSWYLSTTLGIIFLCIVGVLLIIITIVIISK